MYLKSIFLPWLTIRDMGRKLDAAEKSVEQKQLTIDYMLDRAEHRNLKISGMADEMARLRSDLAAEKAKQQPRNPKTGQMMPKAQRAAGKVA
jgi:hypothetical protein